MYPFIRLFKEIVKARRMPALGLFDTHVSHHICWPWDIDGFAELNHGRSLTLYDLGRLPLAARIGLDKVLRRERWGLTMAGASVMWRARVRPFARVEMRSRALGWDARFFYIEQSMWLRDGRCASQVLYRSAVTDSGGIVPTERVKQAMSVTQDSPALPNWVQTWIAADAQRPWPPEPPG